MKIGKLYLVYYQTTLKGVFLWEGEAEEYAANISSKKDYKPYIIEDQFVTDFTKEELCNE